MKRTCKIAIFLMGFFFSGFASPQAQELDTRLFKRHTAIHPETSKKTLNRLHQTADPTRTVFCGCQAEIKALSCPALNKSSEIYWQTILSNDRLPANFSPEEVLFLKADMHAMVPVADPALDTLCGNWRGAHTKNPPPSLRGEFARALFYISIQYHVPLPPELEDHLRLWHLMYPPTEPEERLNSLIEDAQGNRNPFIDHPALVERVNRFQ